MKQLATEFNRFGFEFKQEKRVGNVCIYSKRRKEWSPSSRCYEVIIVRRGKAWEAFGQKFEASEHMPSNEDWGRLGWSYNDLGRAEARMATLIGAETENGGTYPK